MIPDWPSERRRMVDRQLRKRGIRDPRVLDAMLAIPREEFVPSECRVCSYQDEPLQIGYGQTISQPYMIALMAELLELTGTETVLDVGGGLRLSRRGAGGAGGARDFHRARSPPGPPGQKNLARTGARRQYYGGVRRWLAGLAGSRALCRDLRGRGRAGYSSAFAGPTRRSWPAGDPSGRQARSGTARDRKIGRRDQRARGHILPLRAPARRWRLALTPPRVTLLVHMSKSDYHPRSRRVRASGASPGAARPHPPLPGGARRQRPARDRPDRRRFQNRRPKQTANILFFRKPVTGPAPALGPLEYHQPARRRDAALHVISST